MLTNRTETLPHTNAHPRPASPSASTTHTVVLQALLYAGSYPEIGPYRGQGKYSTCLVPLVVSTHKPQMAIQRRLHLTVWEEALSPGLPFGFRWKDHRSFFRPPWLSLLWGEPDYRQSVLFWRSGWCSKSTISRAPGRCIQSGDLRGKQA